MNVFGVCVGVGERLKAVSICLYITQKHVKSTLSMYQTLAGCALGSSRLGLKRLAEDGILRRG